MHTGCNSTQKGNQTHHLIAVRQKGRRKAPFTLNEPYPLGFVTQEEALWLFVIYVTHDVTFKPPAHPPNRQHTLMSTSNNSSHEKIQKKKKEKKKSQSASLTRWYPSSPKAGAFLLFGVWLQTFLPASSKSNNKPSVPWERRGGRARWERGIRHTADTGPAGGGRGRTHRGMTEKEDEESASERCFQLGDEVPRFVSAMTSETEKQNAKG